MRYVFVQMDAYWDAAARGEPPEWTVYQHAYLAAIRDKEGPSAARAAGRRAVAQHELVNSVAL